MIPELPAREPIPELAALDEVAERFGVASRVLLELARAGRFPVVIRATRRRAWVRRDELEKWLQDHTEGPDALAARREALAGAARPALRASTTQPGAGRRLPIRHGDPK